MQLLLYLRRRLPTSQVLLYLSRRLKANKVLLYLSRRFLTSHVLLYLNRRLLTRWGLLYLSRSLLHDVTCLTVPIRRHLLYDVPCFTVPKTLLPDVLDRLDHHEYGEHTSNDKFLVLALKIPKKFQDSDSRRIDEVQYLETLHLADLWKLKCVMKFLKFSSHQIYFINIKLTWNHTHNIYTQSGL